MSWGSGTTQGTWEALRDEPGHNLGIKGQVRGQAGDEGAGAEQLGTQSCGCDMGQRRGLQGNTRVLEMEAGDPSLLLTHSSSSPSVHLAILGSAMQEGGCISLLVSLLIRALSSCQDQLVQGLVPGNFPGNRTSLVADRAAVPWPAPGTAPRGVPGSGPQQRAPVVPHIAMVAGPNPAVIIFYCMQSDIAACSHHPCVLPSLCVAGFAPFV